MLPGARKIILSSGLDGYSKIVILNFDINNCIISEKYSQEINKSYFAEGITVFTNSIVYGY